MMSMSMDKILRGVTSENETINMWAIHACTMMVNEGKDGAIREIVDNGMIPFCIKFLNYSHNPMLQYQACCFMATITVDGNAAWEIINSGAIPQLIELVKAPITNVTKPAVQALGNIATHGPATRDFLLQNGCMPPLVDLIKPDTPEFFTCDILQTISKLCRYENPPSAFDFLKCALPVLNCLLSSHDSDILVDTCLSLSYLTVGPNENIQTVVESGVVPKLVSLLTTSEIKVLSLTLTAVMNIALARGQATEAIVACDGIANLRPLLTHSQGHIVYTASSTISRIAAGNSVQIQQLISGDIIPALIEVLQSDDYCCQEEASVAITNMCSGGTAEQIAQIVQLGILTPFCSLLGAKDLIPLRVVLNGLKLILHAAVKTGDSDHVAMVIEEGGGLEKLRALVHHSHHDVRQKSTYIINTFFDKYL